MAFVIPTIFTAIDRLTAPVSRMQSALVGLATISGTTGANLQRTLRSTSSAAMEVATSSGLIGAAIVAPLAIATKAASDFEKQMSNISTLVDTTKENMGAMGDAVLQVASRVPVKISDLTESLYQIRSAGVDASKAMEVLEQSARLSVAGLSTATEATKAVTSAMVNFKSENLSTAQITDIFFKTVQLGKTKMNAINESFGQNAAIVAAAGVKFAEFQAATAAMTNSGMTAAEAQTALKGATIALIKPSGDMTKALHLLGVTTGQELIQKLGGVVPAMQAVGNAAKQAGLNVNKEFGRVQGLTAYTLLTGQLNDAFSKNIQAMQGANAVNDAYAKQLGTTSAQTEIAKNNLMILGIRIGELLLPALTMLLRIVTPIIQRISRFAHEHKTLSTIIVGSIAAFGLFALTISALTFAVGTVTKAIWLWSLASKAMLFTQGLLTAATGGFNFQLMAIPAFARGAAVGINLMNMSALGLLSTIGRLSVILSAVLVTWWAIRKEFQLQDEQKEKMNAILPHLPQSITPKMANGVLSAERRNFGLGNWDRKLQNIIHPGLNSVADSVDAYVDKYYTQPKKAQDSTDEALEKNLPIMIKDLMRKSDSTQKGEQKISMVIENKTGMSLGLRSTSGPVEVQISDTGSYYKTKTS